MDLKEHFDKFRIEFYDLDPENNWDHSKIELISIEELIGLIEKAREDVKARPWFKPTSHLMIDAHFKDPVTVTRNGDHLTISYRGNSVTKPTLVEGCHEVGDPIYETDLYEDEYLAALESRSSKELHWSHFGLDDTSWVCASFLGKDYTWLSLGFAELREQLEVILTSAITEITDPVCHPQPSQT